MTENVIKHVVIRLPEQVYEVLKNICETFGLTINGYVKSIILDYLSSNNYIENQEIKSGVLIAKISQTSMFYVLGILGTAGWFLHLFYILRALFDDKSSMLGFSENYGIIINVYNYYGEMILEIFLISFIFLFFLFYTIYLFKKGINQNE